MVICYCKYLRYIISHPLIFSLAILSDCEQKTVVIENHVNFLVANLENLQLAKFVNEKVALRGTYKNVKNLGSRETADVTHNRPKHFFLIYYSPIL